MNILLASYFYLPHVGGLWTYADILQRSLRKLGHQVDIFGHAPGMQKYYMVNTGKSIDKSKIKDPIYDNLIKYFAQQRSDIAEWIRWREIERYSYEAAAVYFGLEKYDLIHAQDIVSTRALWRVKPKHTPMISTIHGCLATEYIHSGEVKHKQSQEWSYAWTEEHFGATSSQLTIVPTQWLKNLLSTEFYVPDHQVRVIPYGMDISNFLAKAEKGHVLDVPSSKKLLVCPARLVPVKGHKTLLEALALLKKERNDWVCWLLGDGKLRAELVMEARRLNLQNDVIFMGDRNDVASILKSAHVMVLPSLQDNQPFSVMEAQISGKAVVVSDAGGIPEMVTHGETGLIFPRGDSVMLYTHLKTLLDDDFLRLRMGKNAKKWGSLHWSLDKMVSETLQIYDQIAGSTIVQ
ncbi:group 1 glycosyl transferase [Gordoniibacillus kamchatkensis]|uniref:Group 1 glycosyl transferase n=1 Tax=Gordoniibacillus kamchatkensis TaxID=1590651 RepID=A0ABR5ALE4_9BACL|nr:glycosyltransferase family 4 protein [Paenibacillus sp. VKM B-2647]KIL41613.1 group 1 glycosyl transferase [Paenibacillus sp. VKM B-2647]